MPKSKSTPATTKKPKLTPEDRSRIAKERWAKRKAAQETPNVISKELLDLNLDIARNATARMTKEINTPAPLEVLLDVAVKIAPEDAVRVDLLTEQGTVLASREIQPPQEKSPDPPFVAPPVEAPAPQLAPVPQKKQKRSPQPKEFSSALKEAEKRLGKAINERAEAMAKLAFLQSEIPNLMGIIQALKGSGNYVAPAAYGFSEGAQGYKGPMPPFQLPPNPVAVAQAAQPAPPVSRAHGNAIQLGPDALGTLEGPEDDDEDRFLRDGGVATQGKWV